MEHLTRAPYLLTFLLSFLASINTLAQSGRISGSVSDLDGRPLGGVMINLPDLNKATITDTDGYYQMDQVPFGVCQLQVETIGFQTQRLGPNLQQKELTLNIQLVPSNTHLDEVVISGTMQEVSKMDSPVPIEVYTSRFFRANPNPSLFESLQNINGVRPQLNCNICNTGDIHINGLEGPYTLVLIDGMPIVSGLSSVYGLSGIPQALIDRIEVVKGPASTLYGSEAVGGLINVITKSPLNAPALSLDVYGTSWKEFNVDLATGFKVKDAHSTLGLNYFNYNNPEDRNGDNFTDLTLQNRISVFNNWRFNRASGRNFTLAARYVYEDRWGGEMNWSKVYRGGDEVYGESIYTNRWEFFGDYELPFSKDIHFMFSANGHNQNSMYGNTPYLADQYLAFSQLSWNRKFGKHRLLSGLAVRYQYYDDNTPATASGEDITINEPSRTWLPGIFLQDEIKLHKQHTLLAGIRYDYNSIHGPIFSPRFNYKWNDADKNTILRLSLGSGYRVAHVFTEDHAALTGAREVVFVEDLQPEKSWNANLNFVKKIYTGNYVFIGLDASAFYTHFSNKIIPDYDTDPNRILYKNLAGYAVSQGVSLNLDLRLGEQFKILAGATLMDVYSRENGKKISQLFTENFSAVWNAGYTFRKIGLTVDYTGNLYSPMRLPLLSDTDPRSAYAPWWSIQNIQLTKSFKHGMEIYGGVKNVLNWTPQRDNPFLIARAQDPFDKNVEFDAQGNARITPENPYGLTFDPSYVYGPNQGMRFFLGFRYTLN